MRLLPLSAALLGLGTLSPAAVAQDAPRDAATLEALKSCRAIADPTQRLTCVDREVGAVVAATERGELRVVDRQEVEDTRRRLFGFALPKIGLFGGGDGEEPIDTLETTIASARHAGGDDWILETEEGSVWQIVDTRMGFRAPRAGQPVEFKKAALGSYFIRVNGQMGVKGRRIR